MKYIQPFKSDTFAHVSASGIMWLLCLGMQLTWTCQVSFGKTMTDCIASFQPVLSLFLLILLQTKAQYTSKYAVIMWETVVSNNFFSARTGISFQTYRMKQADGTKHESVIQTLHEDITFAIPLMVLSQSRAGNNL